MKQGEVGPGTSKQKDQYSSRELFVISNNIQLAIIRSFGAYVINAGEWVASNGARFRKIFDANPQEWAYKWEENPVATVNEFKKLLSN